MNDDSLPDTQAEPIATKSLGYLNLVFGSLFLLAVLYESGVVLAMPTFGRLMTWAQSQQQQQRDAQWSARREQFQARLAAAESDEEREVIAAEQEVFTLSDMSDPAWFGFSMSFLDDPSLRTGVMAKLGVMSVLNGLLIASGIGLIRLRRWGRSIARLSAALMLPAILGFALASVQLAPGMAERWTAELRESMFPPMPDDDETAAIDAELTLYEQGMSQLFMAVLVGTNGVLGVYPIIVLVVASRPGVRQAVAGRSARAEGQ
ncbi:hypothetical protein [Tautonia marina]|uniref:hypothetical protein n=1 Tax=Tautonia marina TaxID=2653855 RepID=UPI001260E804|nr:hypothetical protein [Tautonia marina]